MKNKRQVLVILGMHRSGTSLTANFMNSIGVGLGHDLMEADQWNAGGYWESKIIFEIHGKILEKFGRQWHSVPPALPAGWLQSPWVGEFRAGLLELTRSECEKAGGLWGFKDPRTAVLLPLWLEIFEELRLAPLFILCVRHPVAVAASLKRRDGLPAPLCQMLWLKTYVDALCYTRAHPVAFADYDRCIDSGVEQARTMLHAQGLSRSTDEAQIAAAVGRIVRPTLRHHLQDEPYACPPVMQELYALLRRAAIDGKISDEAWSITESYQRMAAVCNVWDGLGVGCRSSR